MAAIEQIPPPASPAAVSRLDSERLSARSTTLWETTWRRLFRRRSAVAGLILLGFLVLVAIFAPLIAPYEPTKVLLGVEPVKRRDAPCIHLLGCPADQPQHLMGIDGNARDQFSRVVFGSRVSLWASSNAFTELPGLLPGPWYAYEPDALAKPVRARLIQRNTLSAPSSPAITRSPRPTTASYAFSSPVSR